MWALPARPPITSKGSIAPNRPEIVTDISTSTCPAWTCDTAAQVSTQLSDGPLTPRRPGRRRDRPPQTRPQLLGHDLDGGSGAAVLSGPGPLLKPAQKDPAALLSDSAACFARSRHTTVKNDASWSRRPDTTTRNIARAIPPSMCLRSGSLVRLPAKLTLASVMVHPS